MSIAFSARSSFRSLTLARPEHARAPLRVLGSELSVPLVTGATVRYVNLDVAATAPCLERVRDAVAEILPWAGSVHRGAGFVSSVSTDLFAAARTAVSDFVGARRDDIVVFTRNTTDALALLSRALPADTTVVTFSSEHHANLLPWRARRSVELGFPVSSEHAVALTERALRELETRHALVAVTGASNVTGELWPIRELAEVAHRHGARVVVDAAQLAPHRAIDVGELGVDYVAFSGHKLYAPFGAGALVGKRDWLDAAEPYLAGGGAVRRVTLDDTEWRDGHARHEAGTPNLVGAHALAVACRALREVGFDRIGAHEAKLTEQLRRGLAELAGVEVLSLFAPDSARLGVASFVVRGRDPSLVAAALSAEHGIGVRDGAFCAHPLVNRLAGGAAVRASVGLGTTDVDVERFLVALRDIVTHGPRWRYRLESGRFVAEQDHRRRPDFVERTLGDHAGATRRSA